MNPTHPGNEPDPGDMSTVPRNTPASPPVDGLPDAEADELGNFA